MQGALHRCAVILGEWMFLQWMRWPLSAITTLRHMLVMSAPECFYSVYKVLWCTWHYFTMYTLLEIGSSWIIWEMRNVISKIRLLYLIHSLLSLILYVMCPLLFVIKITYNTWLGFDNLLNYFINLKNLRKTDILTMVSIWVFSVCLYACFCFRFEELHALWLGRWELI